MGKRFYFVIYIYVIIAFSQHPALAQTSAPISRDGLVLWVDAADVNGDGSQPVDGSRVARWTDKSGTGHDLIAATAFLAPFATSDNLSPTFEAAGFDGARPGLRFFNGTYNSTADKMSGPNLFADTTQADVTIFIMLSNATATSNFAINLNGDNTGDGGGNSMMNAAARFSLHLPWQATLLYFDAGGCCGTTRLNASYFDEFTDSSTAIRDTTLVTAQNSVTKSLQLLRRNGIQLASDQSAIAPWVADGIRIGATSGGNFDGRFGEIIIYDRALSLDEIKRVESYLLGKWRPFQTTVTMKVTSNRDSGSFSFTGNNGIAANGENITVTAADSPASSRRHELVARPRGNTIVSENAPPTGFVVTDISCDGLGAGGTALVDLEARRVTLDTAAVTAAPNIVCIFTNSYQADLEISISDDEDLDADGTKEAKTYTQYGAKNVYRLRVTNKGPGTVTGALLKNALTNLKINTIACSSSDPGQCTDDTRPSSEQLTSNDGFALPTLANAQFYELEIATIVTPP